MYKGKGSGSTEEESLILFRRGELSQQREHLSSHAVYRDRHSRHRKDHLSDMIIKIVVGFENPRHFGACGVAWMQQEKGAEQENGREDF